MSAHLPSAGAAFGLANGIERDGGREPTFAVGELWLWLSSSWKMPASRCSTSTAGGLD
jgi:hypothetical protein